MEYLEVFEFSPVEANLMGRVTLAMESAAPPQASSLSL